MGTSDGGAVSGSMQNRGRGCAGALAGAALAACALLAAGCDNTLYVLHAAEGQLAVQLGTEPIDRVLKSKRLPPEQQAKLELIVRVRKFAIERIGLRGGDSYTSFYDTHGKPLAFNLSAARRDRLTPRTWTFPIVGTLPYLAFFDARERDAWQARLEQRGYDTYTYELDAYSTLGYFPDPVRSPMLRRSERALADTIVHELVHNTIWRTDDTNFNESLATFVGRTGGMQFLAEEYGTDSEQVRDAADYYADLEVVNAFLARLYDELAAYYTQPRSGEELIAGREAVYQAGRERFAREVAPTLRSAKRFTFYNTLPTNNAWMLGNRRYNLDLDAFSRVYEKVGRDWRAALRVFREAAKAPGDPFEYLRRWAGP